MKNIILTIASVAALASAANAQTFPGFENLNFDNSIMTTSPTGGGIGHSWTTTGGSVLLNYSGFTAAPSFISVLTQNGQPLEEMNFLNDGNQRINFNFTGSSINDNGFFFRDMAAGTFVDVIFNRLNGDFSGSVLTAADLNLTSAGWTAVDLGASGVRLTSDGSETWVEANTALEGIASGSLDFGISGSNDSMLLAARNTVVPEPSSTALLGLGALGLLVRRKR